MHSSRELPNGRIIVDGNDCGGGFALEPRTVVTAAHVIGDGDRSKVSYRASAGAEDIGIVEIETVDTLDVGLLRLDADVPVQLLASPAVEGTRFQVDASPGPYDPRLTGVVSAVRWPVTLRSGTRVEMLQLGLDYPLADYAGYSGCAVSSPTGFAVGVLIEQVPDRSSGPGPRRMAPLLYAVPIETVLEALPLKVRLEDVQRPPAAEGSAAAVARAALRPRGVESYFVARAKELATILHSLGTPQAVLLYGLPGAGKSALAVEAAGLAEADFQDGVFYLDMRGTDDLPVQADAALDQILDALGAPSEPRPSQAAQKAALAESMLTGRQVLVVLDNTRDEEHTRPLLLQATGSSTLITSRSALPALPDLTRVEVGAFGLGDGVRLLERLAGAERVRAEPEQADRLVGLCGGLPLALRITGGRAATRPAWSLGEYADLLADERRRLDRLRLGDLDVRASFELSYRLLSEEEQRALRYVGLLRSATIAADAVSAALDGEALDVLETLVDAGLLTAQQQRYEVHELIRLYASELLMKDERRDGLRRLGEFFTAELERQAVALRTGSGTGPLEWTTSERATLEHLPADLAQQDFSDAAIKLALAVGPLYTPLYAWDAWERTLRVGLDATRRIGDEDAAMRLRHNLAVVLGKLGQRDESVELLHRVLDDARAAGNTVLEARALAHLGQRAKQDGRPEEAVELLEASAVSYRRADEPHGLAQALGDCANALDDLGRHDEALARHRDAGQRFEQLGDRYSQGLELGNAGIALQRLDRPDEAADAHRESVAAFESIGAEIPKAVATRRLAETQWQLGHEAQGEQLFATAISTLDAAGATHELAEALGAREAYLVRDGRLGDALADARRSAELHATARDVRGEATERIRIGDLLGDESAIREFVRAEELFAAAGDLPSGPRAHGLSERAVDAVQRDHTATALELWRRAVNMYAQVELSWRAALVLHLAAPMLEEVGEHVGALEFSDRMAAELSRTRALPRPPLWPAVSVRGAADRIQNASLHLWVVQAAEAAGSTGPYRLEVVSSTTSPPGMTTRIDAEAMYVHQDLPERRGLREHMRLGWHIYYMVGGQELIRRGVGYEDDLGPFLLDLGGELLASGRFQESPGTPMFRSRPPPVAAQDVLALGAAVGGAVAGSALHRADLEAWIDNHRGSPFADVALELLTSLAEPKSATELFDTLADYYRRT